MKNGKRKGQSKFKVLILFLFCQSDKVFFKYKANAKSNLSTIIQSQSQIVYHLKHACL